MKSCIRTLLVSGLLACMATSWAQDIDGAEYSARQLSNSERQKWVEVLNKPLDLSALKINLERQINEKLQAAMLLGDNKAEQDLTQLAMQHVPTPGVVNNVARIARDRHQYARAVELHQMAVEQSAPVMKPFFMAHVANDFRLWWKNEEADAWMRKAQEALASLSGERMADLQKRNFLRSERFVLWVRSFIDQRKGNLPQALQAIEKAESSARRAFQIDIPNDLPLNRIWLTQDLADALSRKVYVHRAMGHLVDAEQALRDYLRFAKEVNLTPFMQSGIYATAASLRFAQRDFPQSQRLAQKSLDLYFQAGRSAFELGARNRMLDIAIAMAGQHQWEHAQRQIDKIDASFAQRPTLDLVPYPFERAYIALGLKQYPEAAALFERTQNYNRGVYGESHFFTAQSRGLQGVALWHMGQGDRALALMETAVKDLVHPANADYLDSFGYRPELRQLLISTYISALAERQSPKIDEAMGLADWLKSGTTQEALADAAVRAAAQTQGLADLVRQEQDARQEVKSLRDYLSGQAGAAQSTLPEVAAQMRDRIVALEQQRQTLQSRIKASFPGYERLVRPLPPTLAEMGKALQDREALLFLMPESKGVHVWAVQRLGNQSSAKHHWVDWPLSVLSADVATLRKPLEAMGETGQVLPFADHVAQRLYQKLLAPLAKDLANQSQWIVAASGPLARIPFSLLQIEPSRNGQPPVWLIDRVALTHVPSVGSWLSLRSLGRGIRPDQPLLAWGDPTFRPVAAMNKGHSAAMAVRALRSTPATSPDLDKDVAGNDTIYHDIPPLPETREELIQLAQVLKASSNDLLLGEQATRDSVIQASTSGLLQRKQVVVFATHGLMVGELPGLTQPALAMAANGMETRNPLSPLLTLEDVLGLKLNADWVVLSACNTAAGDGKAEEALSGLARGFFYAGGRSLLVTHWAVESESAKEITTRTFAHHANQKSSPKAESLRQAILQVKSDRRYAHPVFWAPYVLVGDSAN